MEPLLARKILLAEVRPEHLGLTVDEGSLPLVVIMLSILLVVFSLIRRRLETDFRSKASPTRNASSFAVILKAINGPAVAEQFLARRRNVCQSKSNNDLTLDRNAADVPDDLQTLMGNISVEEGDVRTGLQFDSCISAPCCNAFSWGCTSTCTYSIALLLAHREISLKTMQAPPGLEAPAPRQRVTCCTTQKTFEPVKLLSEQERLDSSMHQCCIFSLEELRAMKPPRNNCRLLVTASPQHNFSIYANVPQHRFHIYYDKEEVRSVAWGGASNSPTKMNKAWQEALRTVADTARNLPPRHL